MDLTAEMNKRFVVERLEELPSDVLGYLYLISNELISAVEKHPNWPEDHIHQAGIVCEEAGELIHAALQAEYEDGRHFEMHREALQTGAMALRFLVCNSRSEFEQQLKREQQSNNH